MWSTRSKEIYKYYFWMLCPHLHQHLHSASQAGYVTLLRVERSRTAGTYTGGCVEGAGGGEPSTSSLAAAAALSQLLAIGTGVNHLMCILAHPDRRPIGVRLLGLKRAMHLGTVAAALIRVTCRRRRKGNKRKTNKNGDVRVDDREGAL